MTAEKVLKKKKEFPHSLIVIFSIILLAVVLSWIIPAGAYERVEDPATKRMVVVPDSYQRIEQNPASLFDAFRAIPQGLVQAAWISFMVFIIGGSFYVINGTHATTAFIGKYLNKFSTGNKGAYSLPFLMLPFFLLPAITGNGESMLAFLPMGLLAARSMGYDPMTGAAIVTIGSSVGFSTGLFSPYSTGTAQKLIGLPAFSGLWFRIIGAALLFLSASFWLVHYAKRYKKNPEKNSYCPNLINSEVAEKYDPNDEKFKITTRKTICLIEFIIGIGIVIYAALNGWNFKTDVPAVFIIMAIVIGLTAGYSPNKIANDWVAGARLVLVGALVTGFGRGISVILADANIIDTIVYGLSSVAAGAPKIIAGPVLMVVQSILNCFIISASGQAAATIPIVSPLGDVLGLSQQTVVMAFIYGDGFSNLLLPMNASIMGACAISGIAFPQYIRYTWRLYVTNMVIGMILVGIASAIQLGPF